jgi:hypothetical protein
MTLILFAPLTLALQAAPVAPASPAPAPVSPVAAPASPAPAAPVDPVTTSPVVAPAAASPTAASPIAEPTTAPPPSWYLPNAAPVPVTPASEGPGETASFDAIKYRRLVFSNFYALNFGIFPIPSGDFSFFLGTNLRPRKSYLGKDWNTAIGYQLTLSVGGADYLYGESNAIPQNNDGFVEFLGPIFFHRHALMAQGFGGRKGRFYYAMGGGAVMWQTVLVGIEGEARLGYAFSAREGARLKGVFGGQMRLGGAFDLYPLPQFGLFIGFMIF